ncbi:Sec63 Brl domain-containing protein [Suillus subaureus]|uniref:Sec63 Brl domain-containing protein n=1 Tax=Suillus subaureus TaxID=48587 RepID=A0A9P7JAP6_9AGAM|nr:Sec63 Brl domain-containing protein [Suillus subaureus]KAG1811249.1 Sec63 Brl domain-containing protein [Suillus subaureus]
MANYHYDEAGNMAAYFVISVLVIILLPVTFSSLASVICPERPELDSGCQCTPCVQRRADVRRHQRGSPLRPKFTRKALLITMGWAAVAFLSFKAAHAEVENKVYNPFEILEISTGATEKEIKSRFKELSRLFHPDKVKPTINETIEDIANRFVDITKAYKSLTDETIRRNWELFGHPDGRQEVSMGIALPKWVIEGKNNIWVLGVYGILFGGALPTLVGRWWFGNRQKTKDGINATTAAAFFKALTDNSGMKEVIGALGQAYRWETTWAGTAVGLEELEKQIDEKMGDEWKEVKDLVAPGGKCEGTEQRALVLLYAHFLRLTISNEALKQEQAKLLLQAPMLLNALLGISAARSWLSPTLMVIRLHAYVTQALLPGKTAAPQAQLPGFDGDADASEGKDLASFISRLEDEGDIRITEARKAVEGWSRLDVVDMSFKVIGERLVTPSSIVFLLVKLRLHRPLQNDAPSTVSEKSAKAIREDREKDDKFLNSRKDAEDIEGNTPVWAHAPHWPGLRKPGWWLVLADDKSNRIVVPPMKISDVPASSPGKERDYRSYKLQFQAPPNVGLFTWKVYLVSDTLVGEESCQDISLKIDDISALNAEEQTAEDEISDPEEDSLAGQMAAMRGGAVKRTVAPEESEDESSSDEEQHGDDSSDSD